MLKQMSAIDGIHLGAEEHRPRAQLLVHVVQSMSHRIDGINDKLHLSFLLIERVLSYPFLICKTHRQTQFRQTLCIGSLLIWFIVNQIKIDTEFDICVNAICVSNNKIN